MTESPMRILWTVLSFALLLGCPPAEEVADEPDDLRREFPTPKGMVAAPSLSKVMWSETPPP